MVVEHGDGGQSDQANVAGVTLRLAIIILPEGFSRSRDSFVLLSYSDHGHLCRF